MIPGGLTKAESRAYLTARLAEMSTRCDHGWDRQFQQCPDCTGNEWARFRAILAASVRSDGSLHVCDVRPKTRGKFEPRGLSLLWRRARREHLIEPIGSERSDDVKGRNSHRLEEYFTWLGAEAVTAA